MRQKTITILLLYSFFLLSGRVYALGERILTLGAASSWEAVEKRQGVTEASSVRPLPVLVLTGNAGSEPLVDLHLSFDEERPQRFADSRGRYDVFVSPVLGLASAPSSRIGSGAALFTAERSGTTGPADAPLVVKPKAKSGGGTRESALFATGRGIRDFSIEFWIYPRTMENGGQIVSWNSTWSDKTMRGNGGFINQQIRCEVSRNRFQWIFEDFFFSPGEGDRKSLTLTGPQILPGVWSHHLVRFYADLGLLEYLVDGRLEALDYTTSSGREGGDVYTPVIGEGCSMALGGRFSGMMDEFRVYRCYVQSPVLARYAPAGGRVETRTLDLGHANSRLLKIDPYGGRTAGAGTVRNEYAGNGNLRFRDHCELRFFARASNEPYRWNEIPWVPVNPGTDLSDLFRGRYVQLAADFYPSADGETTPYLSELRVVYHAEEPPPPPAQVTGVSKDGAVELSWRASSSRNVGYLVYYGTASGEYFGDSAVPVSTSSASGFKSSFMPRTSPIDAGSRTSIRIEGLNNGTLYYFAVAAYSLQYASEASSRMAFPEPGDFSRETAVRPLRMME